MFGIIEEMSELIYIVDTSTYELLYMNKAGKASFGIHSIKGKKCYRVLHGLEHPCEFCNNKQLKEEEYCTWENTNLKTQRHYLLKDRLMEYNGKKARVEIAFDITRQLQQEKILQNELDVENLVTRCAKKLCDVTHLDTSIREVLEMAGSFLKATRVYLFEFYGDVMSNTHEWCAAQVMSEIKSLQNLPLSLIEPWKSELMKGKPIVADVTSQIQDSSPEAYTILKKQDTQSLIIVPLKRDEECVGFIGVDNYSTPLFSGTVLLLTSIGYFITAALYQKQAFEKLEKLSFYDSLTKLKNRNRYIRDLERDVASPVGVIFVNVNGMKQKNDKFGHQFGDKILCDVADTLKKYFAEGGCYRVGGDEFVVICPQIGSADFEEKVQKLKYVFQTKGEYSVALGSRWEEQPQDIRDLLYYADEKMYQDKQSFYRDNSLTDRYRFRLDDIFDLSQPGVLTQMIDEEKFVVYFQPKFSISGRKITGAEALIRCRMTENKVYLPERFIPILEETGLIGTIDFYVFEQVCIQIQKWRLEGRKIVPISVNFSRKTLEIDNFVDRLEHIRTKYSVLPGQLEIEITETAEIKDRILLQNIIGNLRKRDFLISIDDFGVKNANLSLFVDLEFDILKIDRHMTKQICSNEKSLLLIEALVQVCHKMNVRLIVEGIESNQQLKMLQQTGCDEGQGYIFSKPIPREQFEETYLSRQQNSDIENLAGCMLP